MQVEFNSCMLYSMLSDLTSITLMTILANIYNIAVCFNKQSDWDNKILYWIPVWEHGLVLSEIARS